MGSHSPYLKGGKMKAFIELRLRYIDQKELHRKYGYEGVPGTGKIFKAIASSWVAEIIGLDSKYKYRREFLRHKKDYSRSNPRKLSGIYAEFILESERIYEVKDFKNRYFCTVSDDGDIIKLNESEVQEWLKNHLV